MDSNPFQAPEGDVVPHQVPKSYSNIIFAFLLCFLGFYIIRIVLIMRLMWSLRLGIDLVMLLPEFLTAGTLMVAAILWRKKAFNAWYLALIVFMRTIWTCGTRLRFLMGLFFSTAGREFAEKNGGVANVITTEDYMSLVGFLAAIVFFGLAFSKCMRQELKLDKKRERIVLTSLVVAMIMMDFASNRWASYIRARGFVETFSARSSVKIELNDD